MSIGAFNEMTNWSIEDPDAIPRYEIYGYGMGGLRKRRYRCKTKPVYVPTNYSRDASKWVELTADTIGDQGAHVVTTIDLRLRSGGEQLQQSLDAAIQSVAHDDDVRKVSVLGDIPGYYRRVIVSKDGKKPSAINVHAARSLAVFGPAILYSYDVSRVLPHIQYTLTKYVDIDLDKIPPFGRLGACLKY